MIKVFKVKGTEIRKVYKCDENGKPVDVIALIGQVKELLKEEIIFDDNTQGNEQKWLVINKDGETINECETLEAAKDLCKVKDII